MEELCPKLQLLYSGIQHSWKTWSGKIEKLGIPKQEVRTLKEPATFSVNGVMSFTRLDFEVELKHALSEIGVAVWEEEAYIRGLRNGAILVLASGPDDKVELPRL